MTTIDDLKQTLAAHAPDADHAAAERPAAVAARVTAVRRRRTAVTALAAATVIGGGALLATGTGRDAGPGPVGDPTPTVTTGTDRTEGYTRDGVTFPAQVDGLPLVAATVGDPGERRIDLRATVPARTELALYCVSSVEVRGGPRMPWVTVLVGDWTVMAVSCRGGPGDPVDFLYGAGDPGGRPGLPLTRTDADGTEQTRHVAPGEEVVYTFRLTDQDGRPYDLPIEGVRLGAGLYAGR